MAFDVQPEAITETDDFILARFQTSATPLESGVKTLAQISAPPMLVSYATGPANFILPQFDNAKFVEVKPMFTSVVVLINTAGLAGPANMTTYAHYLGFTTNGGGSMLFDGINQNPQCSVRDERILVPKQTLSTISLTSVFVNFAIPIADLSFPSTDPTLIFRPEPIAAVHLVFCAINLLVKVYKR